MPKVWGERPRLPPRERRSCINVDNAYCACGATVNQSQCACVPAELPTLLTSPLCVKCRAPIAIYALGFVLLAMLVGCGGPAFMVFEEGESDGEVEATADALTSDADAVADSDSADTIREESDGGASDTGSVGDGDSSSDTRPDVPDVDACEAGPFDPPCS